MDVLRISGGKRGRIGESYLPAMLEEQRAEVGELQRWKYI